MSAFNADPVKCNGKRDLDYSLAPIYFLIVLGYLAKCFRFVFINEKIDVT